MILGRQPTAGGSCKSAGGDALREFLLKFSPFAVIVCSIVDILPISHCSRGRAGWSTVRLQAGFVVPARVAFVVRPSMTAHRGIGSVPTALLYREPCRHHSRDQIDAGRIGWLDEQDAQDLREPSMVRNCLDPHRMLADRRVAGMLGALVEWQSQREFWRC